jgi:hypothetical protein
MTAPAIAPPLIFDEPDLLGVEVGEAEAVVEPTKEDEDGSVELGVKVETEVERELEADEIVVAAAPPIVVIALVAPLSTKTSFLVSQHEEVPSGAQQTSWPAFGTLAFTGPQSLTQAPPAAAVS